jgi:hypothetical protein
MPKFLPVSESRAARKDSGTPEREQLIDVGDLGLQASCRRRENWKVSRPGE